MAKLLEQTCFDLETPTSALRMPLPQLHILSLLCLGSPVGWVLLCYNLELALVVGPSWGLAIGRGTLSVAPRELSTGRLAFPFSTGDFPNSIALGQH